jgi:hypothetical protein
VQTLRINCPIEQIKPPTQNAFIQFLKIGGLSMSNKNNRNNNNVNDKDNGVIENEKESIKTIDVEVKDNVKDDSNKITDTKKVEVDKQVETLQKEINALEKEARHCYNQMRLGIIDSQIMSKQKEIKQLQSSLIDPSKYSGKSHDVKDRRNIKFGPKIESITISNR